MEKFYVIKNGDLYLKTNRLGWCRSQESALQFRTKREAFREKQDGETVVKVEIKETEVLRG